MDSGDGRAADGDTPDANTGGAEGRTGRGRCKEIMALHLFTHKLGRGAREHPHAKITPTGGIFGCSNLVFGAGSKGPCWARHACIR